MLIRFLTEAPEPEMPLVVALGVFDAVHIGHGEIICHARALAAKRGARVAAITFFPHPREVLTDAPPILLLPAGERISLLQSACADVVGGIEFSREFANWSAQTFCRALAAEFGKNLVGIVVGSAWRFGRGGEGNVDQLAAFFAPFGVAVDAVPEKKYRDQIISASRIRDAIAQGFLDDAAAMLGRNVALYGAVDHGFGDAGKLLNAPTINLAVSAGVLPPNGVYAGTVALADGRRYAAAVNCGIAPTFGDRTRRVEAHLIDFSGNLYGKTIKLELLKFIRPEKRFADVAQLKTQIAADVALCREAAK